MCVQRTSKDDLIVCIPSCVHKEHPVYEGGYDILYWSGNFLNKIVCLPMFSGRGGLQCTFFIQEWGGDDAEGVRKGEEEGRFTVHFFHSGMGWR